MDGDSKVSRLKSVINDTWFLVELSSIPWKCLFSVSSRARSFSSLQVGSMYASI